MDSKFVINTLIGAVIFFILGFLIYALALAGYFADHIIGANEERIWWSLVVSQIGLGALMATFLGMGSARDFSSGAKAGAMLGVMFSVAVMFDINANFTVFDSDMTVVVSVLAETVRFACAGAVMAWWMGRD